MIPVKICGITNLEDAQAAARSGASALGLIFYDKSPRNISKETACHIAAGIEGQVPLVGVFVDETLDYVNGFAEEVGLNYIQLHGNESPEYCQKIHFPVIKVFLIASNFDAEIIKYYDVHALLFDTFKKGKPGGTGDIFNWNVISDLKTAKPIILSGGLGVNNIMDGISALCPSAVDVNSGVESKPGIKDEKKMISLFEVLNNTQSIKNPFKIPVVLGKSHEL